MKKKTIADLKQIAAAREMTEELVEELQKDERVGVQKLLQSYKKQMQKKKELEINFKNMTAYESDCYRNGSNYIAGIDEAGRGPLAGPVVAASVILPRDFKLLGLNDSKQLKEKERNDFFTVIKQEAVSFGISIIDNDIIDELNIFEATKQAMREAVGRLEVKPDELLVDAVELDKIAYPSKAIIKGDAKSISIAAASILAKVTRDHLMKQIHNEYPEYDFASNMGYGTKHHILTLKEIGATPYHRKSFAPVKNCLAN